MTLRPAYHFTAPQQWINDPNGLVYLDGEWHLFFQLNPYGSDWGHMSWGHAVSRDLAHWEHLPVALHEQPGYMIYSGSAAVDWENTSGTGGATPALVAAYTAHRDGDEAQHIACSADRGRTWTDAPWNPAIAPGLKDFRDPKIFWHAPDRRWVMVVSLPAVKQVRFYGSADLRSWAHLSDFGPAGATDGVWECPDFFPLSVDGDPGGPKWILKVDNGPAIANHSGGQYFVGDFDGARFTCDDSPQRVRPLDFGPDFYAVQSWNDAPDGRRVWLAWMSHWAYGRATPTSPWRGMMTLPREVALRSFQDGLHLTYAPATELQQSRRHHWHCEAVALAQANEWLQQNDVAGTALEIAIEFEVTSTAETGVKVRVGAAEETRIGVDPAQGQVFVDRSRAGDQSFSPRFDDRHSAPLSSGGPTLRLQVFVDAQSVEVFAADGRVALSSLIFPHADSTGIALFGDARVRSLDVWTLA